MTDLGPRLTWEPGPLVVAASRRGRSDQLASAGGTEQSSGTASTHDYGSADYSYSGTGTYAYRLAGVSAGGALTESGGQGWSFDRATSSQQPVGGSWSTSSSGCGETHSSREFRYSGSGTNNHSVTIGCVSGTITEKGGADKSTTILYKKASGCSGWELTSAQQTTKSRDASLWSYSGGGSAAASARVECDEITPVPFDCPFVAPPSFAPIRAVRGPVTHAGKRKHPRIARMNANQASKTGWADY